MGACAIATPHPAATQAGAGAYRAGGNAIDAALAAAAAVAVAYPHMNSIGGDVMALLRHPDGRVEAIDGSGAAPGGCPVDELQAAGRAVPVYGVDSITVPGAVGAWETLAERGSRLPWASLLEAAITLADTGVAVSAGLARALEAEADQLARDPGLKRVFFAAGRPLGLGDRLRQPALASTLRALAASGSSALYEGDVGRTLIEGLRARGASLTRDDLAAHRTECAEPLTGEFRDFTIHTTPPASQGHVLLEVLGALAERQDESDLLGDGAPLLAALFEGAAEDREGYLGDPRVVSVPVDRLLSRQHARELLVAAQRRHSSRRRGAESTDRATGDTIAIVTADDEGRAVSLIQSVFHAFGARILEPATGILLHNRGSFFSLDPRSPNCLAPGKRPAHTLMAVLVERAGELVGVHGTMGGKAQPQIHAQLLLRLLAEATPSAALAAPRWVVGARAAGDPHDLVIAERRQNGDAVGALTAAGWPVRDLPALDEGVGHGQLIRRSAAGDLQAASDPRADGTAAIVRR